ncbi:MAG: peptide chain release factor N(5)-glutamine methyltransferase [Desulfobacterales bacterium]|nr:peptide chain release factor N(5)-glutamine methyltransferase [Desulfobacterales bacterium]
MQKPSDSQWTILDLIQWTTTYFKSHQIDSPRLTVELLLAHVLGIERVELYMRFDQPMASEELARFKAAIKRRLNREPVAYILGRKDFWDMTFAVDPNVLIPRPETEVLVEAALEWIPEDADSRPMRILELGTGSGAVIVSLAAERPGHIFYASDSDVGALAVARQNAAAKQLAGRIRFFAADWFAPIQPAEAFDLILSNPPYIPVDEISRLAPEIYRYEPMAALNGGEDGFSAIERILRAAPPYLSPSGRLLLEIGNGHRQKAEARIERLPGVDFIRVIKDYGGYDRVLVAARRP